MSLAGMATTSAEVVGVGSGRVGTSNKSSKREKSQQAMFNKHSKSSLNITMESMVAMSNMITPAAEAKLDESNEMLIKDFTLAH